MHLGSKHTVRIETLQLYWTMRWFRSTLHLRAQSRQFSKDRLLLSTPLRCSLSRILSLRPSRWRKWDRRWCKMSIAPIEDFRYKGGVLSRYFNHDISREEVSVIEIVLRWVVPRPKCAIVDLHMSNHLNGPVVRRTSVIVGILFRPFGQPLT